MWSGIREREIRCCKLVHPRIAKYITNAFQINTLLIHYSAANCAHSYQPTGGIFDNDSKTLRDRWIPRGDRNNKASDEKTLITFWMEPRPSPFTPRQNQRERESRRDVTDEQNNMAD